jgi:hypothetical protein
MTINHDADVCDVCGRETIIRRRRDIAFRQWTSKGYVFCRVTVPVGICGNCGARNWDEAAEAIIEEAIKREVEKLP